MEENKGFGRQLSELFAGKGFYIVLLLCAGLIAGSVWLMADSRGTDVEAAGEEKTVGAELYRVPEEKESSVTVMAPLEPRPQTEQPGRGRLFAAEGMSAPEASAEETVPAESVPEESAPAETGAVQPEMEDVDYFIWPVNGRLLRSGGLEALSYDPTMRDWRLHAGWDIAAAPGEPVLCTANGRVSAVYEDPMRGSVVEVSHSNGLVSVYANLGREAMVYPGQSVAVGSVLGTVGNTALSESGMESHLHFELLSGGENTDPADWLPSPD